MYTGIRKMYRHFTLLFFYQILGLVTLCADLRNCNVVLVVYVLVVTDWICIPTAKPKPLPLFSHQYMTLGFVIFKPQNESANSNIHDCNAISLMESSFMNSGYNN